MCRGAAGWVFKLLLELIVVTVGCFIASVVNAAFATGGIYIVLAASSLVFPLTVAVPLQSVFAFGSLVARMLYFWKHIHWAIVFAFAIGATVGVYLGAQVFVSLSESTIALLLGGLLLLLIWFPNIDWRVPLKHPFIPVGALHSFLATMFGVGVLLQPLILRTRLLKLQITGTLAAALAIMEIFKMTAYVSYGFEYQNYIPHIVLATIAGFVGTWVGKCLTHRVSEKTFRFVFKWLITVVGVRLIYKGVFL